MHPIESKGQRVSSPLLMTHSFTRPGNVTVLLWEFNKDGALIFHASYCATFKKKIKIKSSCAVSSRWSSNTVTIVGQGLTLRAAGTAERLKTKQPAEDQQAVTGDASRERECWLKQGDTIMPPSLLITESVWVKTDKVCLYLQHTGIWDATQLTFNNDISLT